MVEFRVQVSLVLGVSKRRFNAGCLLRCQHCLGSSLRTSRDPSVAQHFWSILWLRKKEKSQSILNWFAGKRTALVEETKDGDLQSPIAAEPAPASAATDSSPSVSRTLGVEDTSIADSSKGFSLVVFVVGGFLGTKAMIDLFNSWRIPYKYVAVNSANAGQNKGLENRKHMQKNGNRLEAGSVISGQIADARNFRQKATENSIAKVCLRRPFSDRRIRSQLHHRNGNCDRIATEFRLFLVVEVAFGRSSETTGSHYVPYQS
ncbi:hypothetical protein M9H77_31009 [Catharanthus roseus]|uniref:Uncharacterized protein n=1 Tax=Catharanthus roseus TaxID=4058 RepID=A0ACC0A1I3_CATRO|nr:hypothetical protein M9H77_31009 [Catharanthus roseus]